MAGILPRVAGTSVPVPRLRARRHEVGRDRARWIGDVLARRSAAEEFATRVAEGGGRWLPVRDGSSSRRGGHHARAGADLRCVAPRQTNPREAFLTGTVR